MCTKQRCHYLSYLHVSRCICTLHPPKHWLDGWVALHAFESNTDSPVVKSLVEYSASQPFHVYGPLPATYNLCDIAMPQTLNCFYSIDESSRGPPDYALRTTGWEPLVSRQRQHRHNSEFSVFWDVTQRGLDWHRRFGTAYRSHLKGSSCRRSLTLEDGTDT